MADQALERDREVASTLALYQVESAHLSGVAAIDERLEEIRLEEEAYAQRPEVLAQEPIDAYFEEGRIVLESEEDRRAFQETFGLAAPALDSGTYVFSGVFRDGGEPSILFYEPGTALRIFLDGQLTASLHLGALDVPELDVDQLADERALLVDLISGPTVQIKMIHGVEDEDGILYFVSLHKQIGREIGTLFRKPLARLGHDGELTRFGDLRFLQGIDHRQIEWITLDEEGQPAGEPQRYEYNHWEGVFRIPGPPPTAPRREIPQS